MKRSSTELQSEEGVVEAKKRARSQKRTELQPGTPYGIPIEILEKVLAYVTSLEEILNLELVNKTFRKICWNSLLALRLILHPGMFNTYTWVTVSSGRSYLGGKAVRLDHKEKMKAGISKIWQKSVNLEEIHLDGIDVLDLEESDEYCEFLLSFLLYLEGSWPRKVSSFSFNGRFVQRPAVAFLISFWDQSLQKLSIRCPEDYGGQYEAIAQTLGKCSSLEKVALINYSNTPPGSLSSFLEAVLTNKNVKDLNLDDRVAIMGDWSAEEMDCILNFLENMAVSRNDEYLRFRMSAVQFALISKRLKATGRQLAMVTDLHLTLYSVEEREEIEQFQHISFQLYPTVKKFTICHEAPDNIEEDVQFQTANFPALAVNFLQEFQASSDVGKRSFYVILDREVMGASRILSHIEKKIFLSLGVAGTLDVDRSNICDESWDFVKNSSVKYSVGSGEFVVRFVV